MIVSWLLDFVLVVLLFDLVLSGASVSWLVLIVLVVIAVAL